MKYLHNLDVLVIDDEAIIRESLQQLLSLEGYRVGSVDSAAKALKLLSESFSGVVISDINMPNMNGLQLLKQINTLDNALPVILLTGFADVSMAVRAMHQGAYDFFEKPITEKLLDSVARAIEKRRLVIENRLLKQKVRNKKSGVRILGDTANMQHMLNLLDTVVDTPADVLIQGETGAGKELVARYLHDHSLRSNANFVAINCGAVPDNLIESELFGATKGAYTGASENRIGKFEFAQGGTVFLDEIETTPMSLQVKLLRVLEERKVTPVGSNKAIDLDVRIVAATKVDLVKLAEQGKFRADLYYRLNLVQVDIPPLRARKADIPLLFKHFSSIAANRFHKTLCPLDSQMQQQLLTHDWPGNVRELRNVAERFVLLGSMMEVGEQVTPTLSQSLSLSEKVAFYEQALIEDALRQTSGSVKDALDILQLPRKTFYDKATKYAIQRNQFKQE